MDGFDMGDGVYLTIFAAGMVAVLVILEWTIRHSGDDGP